MLLLLLLLLILAREPIADFHKNWIYNYRKLVITEVAQPFVRGKQQGRPLNYYIQFVHITDAAGYENVSWEL